MVDRDHVLLEKGGNAARVSLTRPRTNAVTVELLHRLEEIQEVDDDPAVQTQQAVQRLRRVLVMHDRRTVVEMVAEGRAVKASTFSGLTTDELSRLQLSLAAPA